MLSRGNSKICTAVPRDIEALNGKFRLYFINGACKTKQHESAHMF